MIRKNEKIKLIFAFKVKYFRQQKGFSYQELADITGLSTSYLHDIEKGKKYPKLDKINSLADAFGIDYDRLVSTKTTKKIRPIIDLLNSEMFSLFPLNLFGLDYYKLFELFARTPDKINAFISTIIKITRHYQMTSEHFYLAALRSYQDMYDNYFEELEKSVKIFRKENKIKGTVPYTTSFLESVLYKKYEISIDREELGKQKKLSSIRSLFIPDKNVLLLNKNLTSAQENFLLGRELAFQYLELKDRPLETRMLKSHTFEKVLNNFKASYFAVALLMDEDKIAKDFKDLLKSKKCKNNVLLDLLKKYDVTPEMLMQRLTNVLPKHLGLKDLFFLRMEGSSDLKLFNLTKELHLAHLHNPHANEMEEHYCRKWISINIIKHLRFSKKEELPIADAQISNYWESSNSYLCLSIAKPSKHNIKEGVSVTLGIKINNTTKKTIHFLEDPNLKTRIVNTTCERCSMPNCDARVAAPIKVEEKDNIEEIEQALKVLSHVF